jgi:hypothetical protein
LFGVVAIVAIPKNITISFFVIDTHSLFVAASAGAAQDNDRLSGRSSIALQKRTDQIGSRELSYLDCLRAHERRVSAASPLSGQRPCLNRNSFAALSPAERKSDHNFLLSTKDFFRILKPGDADSFVS